MKSGAGRKGPRLGALLGAALLLCVGASLLFIVASASLGLRWLDVRRALAYDSEKV